MNNRLYNGKCSRITDRMHSIISSIVFTIIILSGPVFNCSKNTVYDQKYEGFTNNRLRVYVSQSTIMTGEAETGMPMEQRLLLQASKRVVNILKTQIKTQHIGVDLRPFLELFPSILATAQLVMQNCTDTECTAFIDFNVTSFIEMEKKLSQNNE